MDDLEALQDQADVTWTDPADDLALDCQCPDCGRRYSGAQSSGGHCRGGQYSGCCYSFRSDSTGDRHRPLSLGRCLTKQEMLDLGWTVDANGCWRAAPPTNYQWSTR